MCWNFRERRPPPNVSPGICCKCLCMPVKMHAKPPVFNFFTFYPVCTKYPYSYKSYAFFVFGTAIFWRVNYFTNLVPKKLK
jgi:hypothetical protein